MPATEAVAMIEPEEVGLEADVCSMALAACLVAMNTLQRKKRWFVVSFRDRMEFSNLVGLKEIWST